MNKQVRPYIAKSKWYLLIAGLLAIVLVVFKPFSPDKKLAEYCAGIWLHETEYSYREKNSVVQCLHVNLKSFEITVNNALVYKSQNPLTVLQMRLILKQMNNTLQKLPEDELANEALLPVTGSVPEQLTVYKKSSNGDAVVEYQFTLGVLPEGVEKIVAETVEGLKQIATSQYSE